MILVFLIQSSREEGGDRGIEGKRDRGTEGVEGIEKKKESLDIFGCLKVKGFIV